MQSPNPEQVSRDFSLKLLEGNGPRALQVSQSGPLEGTAMFGTTRNTPRVLGNPQDNWRTQIAEPIPGGHSPAPSAPMGHDLVPSSPDRLPQLHSVSQAATPIDHVKTINVTSLPRCWQTVYSK